MKNIIFIHGLESSGNGFKGSYLKSLFPYILNPNFKKYKKNMSLDSLLKDRMTHLNLILKEENSWILIGSSFGGLMATLYAINSPEKTKRLILLAPFLATPLLEVDINLSINIPTIIFHGKNDKIALYTTSRKRATQIFSHLEFNTTEDHHDLNETITTLNWNNIVD
jgi:alpha-beta hydrolase superfamily lysophospholipase